MREERAKIIHLQELKSDASALNPHCLRTCRVSKRKYPTRDSSVVNNTARLYQSEKTRGSSIIETTSGSEHRV